MVAYSKELLPDDQQSIVLHAFDWKIKQGLQDQIHCWGLGRNNESMLIRYEDFPTFCWIELPEKVNGRDYRWDALQAEKFINQLSRSLDYRDAGHAPYEHSFGRMKKLRGFRKGRLYPVVRVCFRNADAQRHCGNILKKPYKFDYQDMKFEMHETKVDIVNKLLTARDVEYSGWHQVVARLAEPDEKISDTKNEYIASWTSLHPIPEEICEQWTTEPGILSIDIECYSNKHRAMPNERDALHVTYMISAIYQRYQQPHTRKRYGIVWGDCNDIPEDKLSNCTIRRVNDIIEMVNGVPVTISGEIMLVRELANITKETDPDIFTGYNIIGFDYRYLDYRIRNAFHQWPNLGRLYKNETHVYHKTWKSAAFGNQTNALLNTDGRISVDLMKIIKRDYKLPKYDLNTVSNKFLGKSKNDVSAPEMFVIYEQLRKAVTRSADIYRQYQNDNSLASKPGWIKKYQKAQNLLNAAKEKTTRVMEYCIQDSELVLDLFDTLNTWIGLVQLSSINRVTIEELFTRGQQIRCYSQLYYAASREGFILDDIDLVFGTFAGGMVHEPEPGLHDNVICLDFASLYPSIIMALNLCWSTLVPEDMNDEVSDSDCHVEEYSQWEPMNGFKNNKLGEDDDLDVHLAGGLDNDDALTLNGNKIKTNKKGEKLVQRHYRHRFIDKKIQRGVLPTIVDKLVTRRRAVNGKIPGAKEEVKCLEKNNFIQQVIKNILENPSWKPGTIEEHEQHIKQLVNDQAAPSMITAAKRALAACELLNTKRTSEIYKKHQADLKDDNVKPRDKPSTHVVNLAALEQDVAQWYSSGDLPALTKIYQNLDAVKEQRNADIRRLKTACVVYNQRQLSLKISANSMFGFTGVQNGGKYPCPEVASTITNYGQRLFHLAAAHIRNVHNGKQVYGDTDSVMFQLPDKIKNSKDCNYWGIRLSQEISGIKEGEKDNGVLPGEKDMDGLLWENGRPPKVYPEGRPGLFPPPLAMEFEKAMRLLCIKKKKYAAYLIAKDGSFKLEDILDSEGNVIGSRKAMMTKGIVLARRDNCKLVRTVYEKILPIVLDMGSLADAMDILIDYVQLLYNQQIPLSELAIIKELGSNYKKESNCMNVFSRNLHEKGVRVAPGDRLDFVVVAGDQPLLGDKMRLLDQLNVDPEPIDVDYYMEHALMNPINQLISIGFKDTLDKIGDFPSILKPRARKKVNLTQPVKFLNIVQQFPQISGKTLAEIRHIIRYNVDHCDELMEHNKNQQAAIPAPAVPKFEFIQQSTVVKPSTSPSYTHLPGNIPAPQFTFQQPVSPVQQQVPQFGFQQPYYQQAPQFSFQQPVYQQAPQFSFQQPVYQQAPQFNFQQAYYQQAPQFSFNQAPSDINVPYLIY